MNDVPQKWCQVLVNEATNVYFDSIEFSREFCPGSRIFLVATDTKSDSSKDIISNTHASTSTKTTLVSCLANFMKTSMLIYNSTNI